MTQHYRAKYGVAEVGMAENFLEKKFLIEQIVALAKSTNYLEQRIAYIMTDHLAEIVLNDALEKIINEYYNNMLSPDIDGSRFNSLRMNFDAKLTFFSSELPEKSKQGISLNGRYSITPAHADILSMLHRYRNDMYHRDQVNKDVLGMLLFLYIENTLNLFKQYQPEGSHWNSSWDETAMAAFTEGNMINFKSAASKLHKIVLPSTFSVSDVAKELANDLKNRLKSLLAIIDEDLPHPDEPEAKEKVINAFILGADFEFKLEGDNEYRKILQQRKEKFSAKDYKESARLVHVQSKYREDALKAHKTALSYAELVAFQERANRLQDQSELSKLLAAYYSFDQSILVYRDRVIEAVRDYDRYVQAQIDFSRGK